MPGMQSSSMDIDIASIESKTSESSSLYPHPRRPPAHQSVSLVHNRSASRARSHSPGIGPTHQPPEPIKRPSSSPSSLKPLIGKDDSGESSNADRWFEKSNNHASRNSTSFVDDSPPFFLQNSSSDETPPLNANGQPTNAPSSSLPLRTGLLHLGTDNSSTEDFRSVIDDLTIENKKLKRKLKGYQKHQDSHLKDQKLFEVRIHGLPAAKKRELEEMLKKFATGLDKSSNPEPGNSGYGSLASNRVPGFVQNQSSDSAYASGSGSGQGSYAQSGSETKQKGSSFRQQNMSIQTFLHDIPEGLLPRHTPAMTEKAKKKLVVRRLEQIYAGKGAVVGNQHAGQQQEVSQLAAKMDRNTYFETRGQQAPQEGIREARIMRQTSTKDFAKQTEQDPSVLKGHQVNTTTKFGKAHSQRLDQRPTRPLDLDPYRAQVPADNFQYFKHLGFSPPGADAMEPPQDGHGWIYLNLLANMAQLHTINVTPEFVRKAVQDYSKKFELSSDGRKIRWRGGKSVTKTSTDGDNTPSVGASGSGHLSSERGSPNKRLKMSQLDSSESGSKPSTGLLERQENKLAYTPLFYHRSSNDDSDTSSSDENDEDTNESSFPFPQPGNSSGMTSSGIKTSSTKPIRKRDTGPIIFYNNAKFCTDLSGDVKTEEAMLYNVHLYHNLGQQPVGIAEPGSSSPPSKTDMRGPLANASELPEAMDLDDNPIPKKDELNFPDQSPLSSQSSKDPKAYEFEVSGLGGVCPADNFTINVQSMHARVDDNTAPLNTDHPIPSRYPTNIAGILQEDEHNVSRKARAAFHKKVLGTRQEHLPPSRLPDASCFMPGDITPEDDDVSDAEDAISVTGESPEMPAPSTAPQKMDLDYTSSSEESEQENEDDDEEDDDSSISSDGSLDLLATARQLDPEAVRQREREYDANMADRLAEEIPAGSSAATAGGGSGFASPASGVDRDEWENARRLYKELRARSKEAKEKRVNLKKRGSEQMDDEE
ncbi:hypothetical protein K461DRAFT_318050 [Myriangium duriaei CBS 260.36]|uniref:Frequency clock protein n=1 Tax=Myriangium duriaei CBS 260.36 TaxID=1168546 RepID=A0A9P4MT15_9PEZI|nr:hypothetical protein K461DRAFT_318050 [Myriangium duriaei CBS 260.36]